ncbi:MAG: RloB domain-containing protein [Clostridia bacterium]|nr:RloB domain-containing protein [Clostridia bacterium]
MSLHPLKKTDMNKGWMQKRLDRSKRIHPEYHLIVTEGTKTEPEYFYAIKELINQRYSERIHLEIQGKGENTVSLFESAKRLAEDNPNGCKHVWIVYDKDDFPAEHFNLTEQLCKNNSSNGRTYHAIWSNQCIELWFLLHFDYLQSDIRREEYYPKLNQRLKQLGKGDYRKNRNDMFSILRPKLDTAISNAKKLYEEKQGLTPTDASPCTTVFQLIETLLPYIKEENT